MNKKYQIFISSTYKDLIEQRNQVVNTILRLGHLPVGMERFNAADQSQWEVIKRHIDNSDYYVVILAHRYGSLDETGTSYTEKEYDYAVSKGIPCMAFVIDNSLSWPPDFVDNGEQRERMHAFKEKVRTKLVNHWTTTQDLCTHVMYSLTEAFNINPQVGWVRGNEASASPRVLEEIARLSKENNELKIALTAHNSQKDEIEEALKILISKEVKSPDDFPPEAQFNSTSLELFNTFGDYFITETTFDEVAKSISKALNKKVKFNNITWVREELLKPLMKLLAILDLINAASDEEDDYWSLTSKGRKLLSKIRHSAVVKE